MNEQRHAGRSPRRPGGPAAGPRPEAARELAALAPIAAACRSRRGEPEDPAVALGERALAARAAVPDRCWPTSTVARRSSSAHRSRTRRARRCTGSDRTGCGGRRAARRVSLWRQQLDAGPRSSTTSWARPAPATWSQRAGRAADRDAACTPCPGRPGPSWPSCWPSRRAGRDPGARSDPARPGLAAVRPGSHAAAGRPTGRRPGRSRWPARPRCWSTSASTHAPCGCSKQTAPGARRAGPGPAGRGAGHGPAAAAATRRPSRQAIAAAERRLRRPRADLVDRGDGPAVELVDLHRWHGRALVTLGDPGAVEPLRRALDGRAAVDPGPGRGTRRSRTHPARRAAGRSRQPRPDRPAAGHRYRLGAHHRATGHARRRALTGDRPCGPDGPAATVHASRLAVDQLVVGPRTGPAHRPAPAWPARAGPAAPRSSSSRTRTRSRAMAWISAPARASRRRSPLAGVVEPGAMRVECGQQLVDPLAPGGHGAQHRDPPRRRPRPRPSCSGPPQATAFAAGRARSGRRRRGRPCSPRTRRRSPAARPSPPAPRRPLRGRAAPRWCRPGRRSRPRSGPTPTVSTSTTSQPAASSTRSACGVAQARPPRCPRVAIERMNTPSSVACSPIRTRSPSNAPPENGDDGSTASTPTRRCCARSSRTSSDVVVDLPTPGGPVSPTTCARPVYGASAAATSRSSGPPSLDQRDQPRDRQLLPAPGPRDQVGDAESGARSGPLVSRWPARG